MSIAGAIGSGTMQDWTGTVLAAALAVALVAVMVVVLRARSRTRLELERARAETAALQAQLEDLERRVSQPAAPSRAATDAEFLITDLGQPEPEPVAAPQIGGALFADIVLRETVVKAASLAHGVRRAMDAETRNRIRFEMRREVRRARKQRRVDTKQARREWEARQRAALDGGPAGSATQDPAA